MPKHITHHSSGSSVLLNTDIYYMYMRMYMFTAIWLCVLYVASYEYSAAHSCVNDQLKRSNGRRSPLLWYMPYGMDTAALTLCSRWWFRCVLYCVGVFVPVCVSSRVYASDYTVSTYSANYRTTTTTILTQLGAAADSLHIFLVDHAHTHPTYVYRFVCLLYILFNQKRQQR